MWAACCNWLCVDAGPPEEIPRSAPDRSAQTVRTSPPFAAAVTCRACGTRLQSTRKLPCVDCKNNFCGSCLQHLNDGLPLCQLCGRIRSTSFIRDELLKLKVKDLRDYLSMRDVPTDLCREKEELVQLVLTLRPVPSSYANAAHAFPNNQSNSTEDLNSTQTQPAQDIPATNQNLLPNLDDEQVPSGDQQEDETESIDSEEILVPGRRASLSDIRTPDDIESLSVRQLKEILARNFVNYKGCCEKWELMERVTRLYYDQKELQKKASVVDGEGSHGDVNDENLCKVCMDSHIDCVLLECGHMVTCTKCGMRMSECPICRQYVVRAVHVFRT